MRICIVCTGFSSGFGGLETAYRKLCEKWKAQGHEIFVISGLGPIQSPKDFKVLKVPYIQRTFFDALHPLTKLLPLDSYELEGLSCLPFVMLRLIKLKSDIVLTNTIFETVAPLMLGLPCLMVSQAAIPNRLKIFEKVDRVIVNDSQSYERLKKLGIETELILNGVESVSDQKTDVKKLRAKHSIPADSTVFLTVARLQPFKQIHLLIEAFKLIKQPATLIIIGDGPELPNLKKQASEANLQNKIIFLQHVSQQELAEFYQLCDVFSLPSLDAFGIVFLEALSFGKPVVTNPSVTKKSVIGKFGIYANVEDSKEYSESLLKALSIQIDVDSEDFNRHMQKFNWDNIALQYIRVFQEVLDRRL